MRELATKLVDTSRSLGLDVIDRCSAEADNDLSFNGVRCTRKTGRWRTSHL